MFEIQEKQKVLPDGTRLTTFTREVTSANTLEVEAGTNGFKGGNAEHGSRTYIRIRGLGGTDMFVKTTRGRNAIPVKSSSFLAVTASLKPS